MRALLNGSQCEGRIGKRIACNLLLVVPFLLMSAAAAAEEATYESLSTEADALSEKTTATEYVESAQSIFWRAKKSLKDDQLQSILDQVGGAATRWLQQEAVAASATTEEAKLLVDLGLSRLEPSKRATVAAQWLRQSDAVTRFPIWTFDRLAKAARSELTETEKSQLVSQMKASLGDLADVSFEELRNGFSVRAGRSLYQDRDEKLWRANGRELVSQWAATHDPSSIAAEDLDWVVRTMTPPPLAVEQKRTIDATWQARLVPPRSGPYTFSISGVRPDPRFLEDEQDTGDAGMLGQWITVRVDGRRVLEGTPQRWQMESSLVTLEQGVPVPVEVSLRYQMESGPRLPVAAQLYWSGPGIERQLIAESFYRLPGADQPGVAMMVRCNEGAGERVCETTVSAIDQILGVVATCEYEPTLSAYIEKRFGQLLAPDAMSSALTLATAADPEKRQPHPLVKEWIYEQMVVKAPSQLRSRLAMEMAANPAVLRPVQPLLLVRYFEKLRFGAERESLDMVGAWMMLHADRGPELAADATTYHQRNRECYRWLANSLVYMHPPSTRWLEDYLMTEEGRCSLPAAYTLAYVYLNRGELLSWIALLDAKLDEDTLSGDQRVNWLIARAMAEEIRGCPENDHRTYRGCERLLAGFGWLDEAMLIAQSSQAKARVAHERAARLAAFQSWEQAQAILEGHPELAALQSELAELQTEVSRQQTQHNSTADAAFLAELRRRLAGAQKRQDSSAASRYTALIEQLSSESGSDP